MLSKTDMKKKILNSEQHPSEIYITLLQPVTYHKLDSTKRLQQVNYNNGIYANSNNYILNSY